MSIGLWAKVEDLAHPDAPNALEAIQLASWLLHNLSGRKYPGIGCIEEQYACRPCGTCVMEQSIVTGCECGNEKLYTFSSMTGERVDRLPTMYAQKLWLTHRPVRKIISIRKTGSNNQIDPSLYSLYGASYISGPSCSDGCPDLCDVCVEYEFGTLPPVPGQNAARILADEFVKAVEDPGECRLPSRVTSITRQGVSFTLLDPQDFLSEGRVGIYAVDLFIRTANPNGALARPRIFSPDLPRARSATSRL